MSLEEQISQILEDYREYNFLPTPFEPNLDEWDKEFQTNHNTILLEKSKLLLQLIQSTCLEVIGDAPSCEPDCSDVRHAYHQGGWDLTIKQRQKLTEMLK